MARAFLLLGSAGVFVTGVWSAPRPKAAARPAPKIEFNRDVRPVLSKCFSCHGHDPKAIQADLRLDKREGALKLLGSGKRAIVPFHPEKSELVARIYAKKDEGIMPLASSNKILSGEEKAILKQWIAEGAVYKEHWAFVPPVRPALPAVKQKAWPRNGIDNFILARIEQAKMKPAPEADRNTLIRRVSLDLTGLPPTPQEVDAFVADRKPKAYERLVDRLLASPRYGERMAMDWMDYARYADSNGYQADFERFQWRWRDWVIEAFNHNMPYDQFTIEQIAGDLLPNATLNQKIATGFGRNHRINTEGGVVAEEWRIETVIDRVETTSTVWLGLTTGCARCHDHKYDPVTQRDFYRLFSYFNNVPESGTGEERPVNHPPLMKAPYPAQAAQMASLEKRLGQLESGMKTTVAANDAKTDDWKVTAADPLPSLHEGLLGRYDLSGAPKLVEGSAPAPTVTGKVTHGFGRSTGSTAVSMDGYVSLGNVGDFSATDRFSFGGWVNPKSGGSLISRMDSSHDYRGWDVSLDNGRLGAHIIDRWPESAAKVFTKSTIPNNEWSHVFVTYDGSRKASGLKIYINGEEMPVEAERDALNGPINTSVPTLVGRRYDSDVLTGEVDDMAIYSRALSAAEIKSLASVHPAVALLRVPPAQRTADQRKRLAHLWSMEHDEAYRKATQEQMKVDAAKQKLDGEITTVMVMDELPKPREAHILIRGQYDHPGPTVTAGLPQALVPSGTVTPNNRLGLARWIVSPKNPLTGRVTVNRLWERFFGAGLVSTSEDFGTRADFPTHPELLDYMATEFVRLKWDMKAMIREMVTSATYRQSSEFTPAQMRLDPTNKLLSRGPRFRLPAEVLRDQAMYAGGMLVEKVGGPSVRPYQPDGVWDELNVYGNLRNYKHDMGDNLHRRSLYTIWKRTAAPPIMTLFDAATRETCRVRRSRTDTPLQALALMNDVTYLEAGRGIAQRMLREGGAKTTDRVKLAFRLLLARAPTVAELRILSGSIDKRVQQYRQNPEAAKRLISIGDLPNDPKVDAAELAAYTIAASTVLNLDEAVTKE